MADITLIELNKISGFTGEIKILSSTDEKEVRKHGEDWCEINNSIVDEIRHIGNFFIAPVSPDDYS